MIDFEGLKPGTLLLLDHDPYGNPNRVVTFRAFDRGFVGFECPGRTDANCWRRSVVCVAPPKPEMLA